MTILLGLLTIHFVADFLLQTDWMAINKSKNWKALLAHTSIYSLCFVMFGWKFVLVTFLLHTLTDAATSRITSKLWFIDLAERSGDHYGDYWTMVAHVEAEKRHWFFVMIGLDQLIHAWSLAATHMWLF